MSSAAAVLVLSALAAFAYTQRTTRNKVKHLKESNRRYILEKSMHRKTTIELRAEANALKKSLAAAQEVVDQVMQEGGSVLDRQA